jgi:hypothetical protein
MARCCVIFALLFLIPQAAHAYSTVLGWFTDADIGEGYKLDKPSGAPDPVEGGTKGSCFDMTHLTQGYELRVPSMLDTTRGTISFWLRPNADGRCALDCSRQLDPQIRSARSGRGGMRASGGNGTYDAFELGLTPELAPQKTPAPWSPSDHVLLKAGDPASDGLQISWNNATGTLRFTMAGKNGAATKVTTCRADISGWAAHDWHHVQVAWLDYDGAPMGLAIWIDRVAVASCVFGGTQFMTPPFGYYVTIGDPSSDAWIDELVFHGGNITASAGDISTGATPIAYRDYFRTAPYIAIEITHKANLVESDSWVILSKKKQFGVIATKLLNAATQATTTEYITNFDKRYCPWSLFDAKPYITWTSSDTSTATVDTKGLVTGKALTTSPITLRASFAGLEATYPLSVQSWDKCDLDLLYVERIPRYSRNGVKKWPDVGETVRSIVHYANFGYQATGSGSFDIRFEIIRDTNGNWRVDADEHDPDPVTRTISSNLAPCQAREEYFTWTWPETPVFIRVTLDPDDAKSEICEANNQRCEMNIAKACHWGYRASEFGSDYSSKVINLVGSFSGYDWTNAESDRMALLMRETVLPTTSPDGILESLRIDKYTAWLDTPDWWDEPWVKEEHYYDGGFPRMERENATPMDFDTAVGHELGHTSLWLPDLYGYPMTTRNLFLRDEEGYLYGGTPVFPVVRSWNDLGTFSSAPTGQPDPLCVGYTTLMDYCNPWLDPMSAGLCQAQRQDRDWWHPVGYMCPRPQVGVGSRNSLMIYGADDAPLRNAAVYIYQCVNTAYLWSDWNKYFPDRPKFAGNTGGSGGGAGVYAIPTTTATTWDDWSTSTVEGAVTCLAPFDRVPYMWDDGYGIWGPSWQVGEMLAVKIVGANDEVEIHILPYTEFMTAYFTNVAKGGSSDTPARYTIRTNLTSASSPVPIDLPSIPPEIQHWNSAPVAVISGPGEISVPAGHPFSFDGSGSYDPESQPLEYRWTTAYGYQRGAVMTEIAPDPGVYEYQLFVTDGVRYSDQATVVVTTY